MTSPSSSYGSIYPGLTAPDRQKPASGDHTAPYAAEFVGTFVLVLTAGCLVLSPASPTWTPTAVGCILTALIYSTGPVSGGSLNPAVSFSLGLIGTLRWVVVFRYWLVQVSAGFLASLFLYLVYSPHVPAIGPVEPFTWEYAVTAEVIYTFLLCFVVNNCAASKRNNPKDDPNQFYALAIGFAVIAGGYSVGNVSGSVLNPAIAIGMSAGDHFRWAGSWIVAELVGAVLAAIMYRAVRPEEYNPPEGVSWRNYDPPLHVRCASEFLGAFIVMLTVGLNVTMESPATGFAAAAAVTCMVYSLANISGGHFNPAVTLAVVLSGRDKCPPGDGAAYMVCQLIGGSLAGLLYAQFHAAGPHSGLTFTLKHGPGYGPNAAGVVEAFFSFFLAYAMLACATTAHSPAWKTRQNFYRALVIGFCVASGGIAAGRISGGKMNPAVSVGVTVANVAHRGWSHPPPPFLTCMVYSLWQLTGGLLAAVSFSVTHPDEYKKAPLLAK